MNESWQIRFVDGLEALDREEAPHGLYGVRQARSDGSRLPGLAHCLSASGRTGFLRRNGFRGSQSPFGLGRLNFTTEAGKQVVLEVLDYATTKVRHYGSAYRLDEHHGKPPKQPLWDLEILVPKLSTRRHADRIRGILLIVHYRHEREISDVLGRTTGAGFLDRYELLHVARGWEDRYGRDFQTVVHLWTQRVEE